MGWPFFFNTICNIIVLLYSIIKMFGLLVGDIDELYSQSPNICHQGGDKVVKSVSSGESDGEHESAVAANSESGKVYPSVHVKICIPLYGE